MSVTQSLGSGSLNISQTAGFPAQLSAALSGAYVQVGILKASPVIIIFNNRSAATTTLGIGPQASGGSPTITTWMTFAADQVLALTLRTNNGNAPNFTIPAGTAFWANGASGTFTISYLTAIP
jgi:hypothetical protein